MYCLRTARNRNVGRASRGGGRRGGSFYVDSRTTSVTRVMESRTIQNSSSLVGGGAGEGGQKRNNKARTYKETVVQMRKKEFFPVFPQIFSLYSPPPAILPFTYFDLAVLFSAGCSFSSPASPLHVHTQGSRESHSQEGSFPKTIKFVW